VVGGGDIFVTFKDDPATRAFVQYLATPQAGEIWAKLGGHASPNKNLNPELYPDEISKATATALADAQTFRFDMSDLARRVRWCRGSGRVEDQAGFPEEPE
jgi:alpha-glucoside transport system substrate-binding protein